jgi:hypothetical protein
MTSMEVAYNFSCGHVQGGKQGGGAMTLVVMGATFDLPGSHRQQRCGAVQRLDLGLLIDAQYQGLLGRAQVKTDDRSHLVHEKRVFG